MEPKNGRVRASAMAWIAFALLVAVLLIPVWNSVMISFKDYKVMLGINGSPWVGSRNYTNFLQSPYASRLLGNSLTLGTLGIVGALALGIVAAWFVPRLENRGFRHFAMVILLLPVFVPSICWTVGIAPRLTDSPTAGRMYYLLCASLSGGGLIGFMGTVFAAAFPRQGFWRGVGWSALLSSFLLVQPNAELLRLLYNPSSYETMDVLDTYVYRSGLMQMDFGTSAAVYVLRAAGGFLLGLLVCAVAYIVLHIRKGDVTMMELPEKDNHSVPFPVWVAAIALAGVAVLWFTSPSLVFGVLPSVGQSLFSQLICALLSGLWGLIIAWVMISALRSAGFLLFCAIGGILLSFNGALIGSYIAFRSLGSINTVYPIILLSAFTPAGLLLTLLCARLAQADPLRGKPVWMLALLPACFAAAQAWAGIDAPVIFLNNASMFPHSVMLREQMFQRSTANGGLYLLALLPALALCALGAWFVVRAVDGERQDELASPGTKS